LRLKPRLVKNETAFCESTYCRRKLLCVSFFRQESSFTSPPTAEGNFFASSSADNNLPSRVHLLQKETSLRQVLPTRIFLHESIYCRRKLLCVRFCRQQSSFTSPPTAEGNFFASGSAHNNLPSRVHLLQKETSLRQVLPTTIFLHESIFCRRKLLCVRFCRQQSSFTSPPTAEGNFFASGSAGNNLPSRVHILQKETSLRQVLPATIFLHESTYCRRKLLCVRFCRNNLPSQVHLLQKETSLRQVLPQQSSFTSPPSAEGNFFASGSSDKNLPSRVHLLQKETSLRQVLPITIFLHESTPSCPGLHWELLHFALKHRGLSFLSRMTSQCEFTKFKTDNHESLALPGPE
jgi:phage gp46-like protein